MSGVYCTISCIKILQKSDRSFEHPRKGCSTTIRIEHFLNFNPTEKVIDIIMVELDKIKLFLCINYGRKIGINYSRIGSNSQILINPTNVIFEYGNPYIFSDVRFY